MRVGVPSYREGTGNRQTELNPQPSGQSDPQIPPPQPARRRNQPGIISKGFLNGSATSLPQPPYPRAARAVRAAGTVSVQVTVDEDGNVISASAAGGHPLLRQAAVGAARRAKFRPTLLSGQPVKVTGIIVYTFTAQ
jgi:TonB family protein